MRLSSVTQDDSVDGTFADPPLGSPEAPELVLPPLADPFLDPIDDHTLSGRRRQGPLCASLAEHVVELVLERPAARLPHRRLSPRTPAIAVSMSARAIDLGGSGLAIATLFEVAARAVSAFCDHGFLVVIRPGDGPTFVLPLPVSGEGEEDDAALDPVVAMCRQLDEEQLRHRAVAIAQRLSAELERAPALRELLIELRLGEGLIVGAPETVGMLLPGAVWQPA